MRRGRLQATLVYFGLLEDPAERARPLDAPTTPWHWLASAVAILVAVAVVIAVAALFGISPTWPNAIGIVAALIAASAGAHIKRQRRQRSGST